MPTHIYLVNVTYNEEKNEMITYFKNSEENMAKRYKFFPYINLPKEMKKDAVEELLLFFKIKKFQIKETNKGFVLACKSFEDLKKATNLIAKTTSKKPIIVNPERAFLIEKNWGYFDSFTYNNNEIEKNESDIENFADLVFLELPFNEALRLNEEESIFLVKQIALSNILKLSPQNIPKKLQEQTEIFLENIYFENGGIISWVNECDFFSSVEFAPFGFFDKISKLDFSQVWAQLITNNFFNLGQETINCACCKPIKMEDVNLLPNSQIRIEFKENSFYFESSSHSFAVNFHKKHTKQDLRLNKKKEFFMKSYPVGPFNKKDSVLVPIEDAKLLLDEEKATLAKEHELSWFCKKEESFISREIKKINSILFKLKKSIPNKTDFKTSFVDLFKEKKLIALKELLCEVPFQLTSPLSNFFSPSLAQSIIAVQESTIRKFNDFSEKKGYRVLHVDKRSAYIKGYSSLMLAKSFSKELDLPQPAISTFSLQTKLKA